MLQLAYQHCIHSVSIYECLTRKLTQLMTLKLMAENGGRKSSSVKRSTRPTDSSFDGKKEPGRPVENGWRSHQESPYITREPTCWRRSTFRWWEAGWRCSFTKWNRYWISSWFVCLFFLNLKVKSRRIKMLVGRIWWTEWLQSVRKSQAWQTVRGCSLLYEDRSLIKVRIPGKGAETIDDAKTNPLMPSPEKGNASIADEDWPSLRVKDKRGSAKGQKGSSAGYGILKERCRWSNFSIRDSPPHWFYLIFILGRWWGVILPLCSCYVGKCCSFVKVGQKRPRRWTSPCWDPQGQGQEKAQGWRTTTSWDPQVKGKRKRPPLKEAYFSTAVSAFGEHSTCIIKGKKSCVFLYLV